jgi:hypothetical protein
MPRLDTLLEYQTRGGNQGYRSTTLSVQHKSSPLCYPDRVNFDNPTDAELQKFWNDFVAKWTACDEHPLARHPHAVKCDGAEGCWTVAPIRDLSDPNCFKKRYCHEHLPPRRAPNEV